MSGVDKLLISPMRWWEIVEVCSIENNLYPTTPWSQRTFWSELALMPVSREYVTLRKADTSGPIVGYAGLALSGRQADIQTLAIASSHQRQGLGQYLLKYLLDLAKSREATEVLLDVGNTNEAAIALYLKNGFVEINRRRGCYRGYDETLIMRKPLSKVGY
jgi:ribosomal-protein-alanine N-acetyltransferase